jgi:hypothetical protein
LGSSRAEPEPASRTTALLAVPLRSGDEEDACDAEPRELTASTTLVRPNPCVEERTTNITKAPIAAALTSAAEMAAAK